MKKWPQPCVEGFDDYSSTFPTVGFNASGEISSSFFASKEVPKEATPKKSYVALQASEKQAGSQSSGMSDSFENYSATFPGIISDPGSHPVCPEAAPTKYGSASEGSLQGSPGPAAGK